MVTPPPLSPTTAVAAGIFDVIAGIKLVGNWKPVALAATIDVIAGIYMSLLAIPETNDMIALH